LRRLGHTVVLVSPPEKSVPVWKKLKTVVREKGWRQQLPLQSHLDGGDVDHRVLEQWRPIIDADVPDADVVIATWWETAEWVNALDPRKGAKVYFIQHHEVFHYLPVERARATYRLPMHKIVVARWLKEVMRDEYDDLVVDLVPNSVDHTQFFAPKRSKQRVPTAGFLYSHTPFKGVETSISALTYLRKEFVDLRIVCFGSVQPRREYPIPIGAEFVFSPAQDSIRNIYSTCDVWLTASRSEGFNLPAMEAMACRTPVVSTRTGWPAEAIVPGWNGAIAEIDDVDALVRGLRWVLSQTEDAWQLVSSNAYATVSESSWDQSTALFERALVNAQWRASRGEIAGRSALS